MMWVGERGNWEAEAPVCYSVLFSREKNPTQVGSLSHVRLFVTPWTVARQAPLSMEFSRQEYWSGLPFPFPGDLPSPGIEPRYLALQADSLPVEPQGKPKKYANSWPIKKRFEQANFLVTWDEKVGLAGILICTSISLKQNIFLCVFFQMV